MKAILRWGRYPRKSKKRAKFPKWYDRRFVKFKLGKRTVLTAFGRYDKLYSELCKLYNEAKP